MRRVLFSVFAILIILTFFTKSTTIYGYDSETSLSKEQDQALAYLTEIIELRNTLAAENENLKGNKEITVKDFKNTCGAVGARIKAISKETAITFKHETPKYRNPAHKLTKEMEVFYNMFDKNKDLKFLKDIIGGNNEKGREIIVKPIFVEESCLKCHGAKENRPEFIKKKYPNDLAFDFNEGDLRAIFTASLPTKPAK